MKSTTTDRVHRIAFAALAAITILLLTGCPQNLFYGVESAVRDDEGPVITFINPSDGQAVSGTLVVTGIATDKYRVTRVSIQLNGQAAVELEGTNNWYYTLDTSLLQEGPHTITVIARDEWGNVSQKSVSIVVDQSVPEVSIPYDPAEFENYFSGTNVELSGTADDDNEVARVQISFDGGVTYQDTELVPDGSEWRWSYTIADTAAIIPGDGSTTMLLRVYDDAGLIGSNALLVFFDNTPPEVTIGTPADNVTIDSSEDLHNDTLVVSGTASDNLAEGVGEIVIQFRDGIVGAEFYSDSITAVGSEGITNYSKSFDLTAIGPPENEDVRNYGMVDIRVIAYDRARNSASTTIRVSLDDDPPAFADDFIVDGESLNSDLAVPVNNFAAGTFTIEGDVTTDPTEVISVEVMAGTSENSGSVFGYELIDNPNDDGLEPGAVGSTGNWSYTLDDTRFDPDGTYYLTFRVTNSRGGFDRVSRRIRFDRVDPTVLVSTPEPGALVSGENVSISGQVSGEGSPLQFIDLVITDDAGTGGSPAVLVDTRFSGPDFSTPDPPSGAVYGNYADLSYSSGGFSWRWDTTAFTPDADIEIAITATDMAGNTFTESVVVTQDADAPIGRFTEYDHPTNPGYSGQPLIPGRFINGSGTIRGEAEGTLGIKTVEISRNNVDWEAADISALPVWEYELPGLSNGSRTLYLRVTDNADSVNTSSIAIEVDNTPPVMGPLTIDLLDGSGTPYYHGTVAVSGSATDADSDVVSVVATVDAGADPQELAVDGTSSYSADWDTQTVPTVGGVPVMAMDGITVRATAVDAAGNTASEQQVVDVRPYVASVNRSRAYLGETGLTVAGNNLGDGTPGNSTLTIGGGMVTLTATSANSLTFTLPGAFPPADSLSSGPVIVTYNGVSNAAQTPLKMDLFAIETVISGELSYPDAQWSGGKMVAAYAVKGTGPARHVHYFDGDGDRSIADASGGQYQFIRTAYESAEPRAYVSYARDGLRIRSSTDDFATAGGEVVISASATYNDIATDGNGTLHVVYYDGGSLYYRASVDQGASFSAGVEIDGASSDAGQWVVITVDSSNRVHATYHDATANSLKYTYRPSGGNWAAPITVNNTAAGSFGNGIAVDPDGGVHISYYHSDNGNLMYAYASAPTASFESRIVDSQGITGWFSSIALDAANSPHITYASFSALKPKYARLRNGSFMTVTVAESAEYDINNNSNSTATVIDGAGYVNMIYTTTDEELRRAVYLPE